MRGAMCPQLFSQSINSGRTTGYGKIYGAESEKVCYDLMKLNMIPGSTFFVIYTSPMIHMFLLMLHTVHMKHLLTGRLFLNLKQRYIFSHIQLYF